MEISNKQPLSGDWDWYFSISSLMTDSVIVANTKLRGAVDSLEEKAAIQRDFQARQASGVDPYEPHEVQHRHVQDPGPGYRGAILSISTD